MTVAEEKPNVVRDITIGHTRIRIADNYYKDKSRDDVIMALKEIARTAQANIAAAVRDYA